MSHPTGVVRRGSARRLFRRVLSSPFRPQTYLNLLYLSLAFPLGIAYFVFLVTGVSLGVGLAVVLVGVPILLTVLLTTHVIAAFERATARHLLSVEIDSPGYPFLDDENAREGFRSLLLGRETYKAMGYLGAKLAIGIASFTLLITLLTMSVALVLTPLYYANPNTHIGISNNGEPVQLNYGDPNVHIGFVNNGDPVRLTPSLQLPWNDLLIGAEFAVTISEWQVTTLPEALAVSVVGFLLLAVSLSICNAFAWIVGQFSRVLLSASSRDALEDLQDGLAAVSDD